MMLSCMWLMIYGEDILHDLLNNRVDSSISVNGKGCVMSGIVSILPWSIRRRTYFHFDITDLLYPIILYPFGYNY